MTKPITTETLDLLTRLSEDCVAAGKKYEEAERASPVDQRHCTELAGIEFECGEALQEETTGETILALVRELEQAQGQLETAIPLIREAREERDQALAREIILEDEVRRLRVKGSGCIQCGGSGVFTDRPCRNCNGTGRQPTP